VLGGLSEPGFDFKQATKHAEGGFLKLGWELTT
jgi:hypothetical protein